VRGEASTAAREGVTQPWQPWLEGEEVPETSWWQIENQDRPGQGADSDRAGEVAR